MIPGGYANIGMSASINLVLTMSRSDNALKIDWFHGKRNNL